MIERQKYLRTIKSLEERLQSRDREIAVLQSRLAEQSDADTEQMRKALEEIADGRGKYAGIAKKVLGQ